MYSIYTITNQGNDKVYVGQTKGPVERRLRCHIRDSRSPSKQHVNMPLLRAIQKYGEDNFSIIPVAECATREEANRREKLFIIVLNATDRTIGYNVSLGGLGSDGSRRGVPVSRATRQKMSIAAKERCARNSPTHCPKGHPYRGGNVIFRKSSTGQKRKCRACQQERDRQRLKVRRPNAHHGVGRGGHQKLKTHCPKGHEYTAKNTILVHNGRGRACRACSEAHLQNPGVGTGGTHKLRTHCPKGHPYSGPNLIIQKNGHRLCRACRANRASKNPGIGKGGTNALKTHCPNGHPYAGDNLILRSSEKTRRCRICTRDTDAKRRDARKRNKTGDLS